MSKFSDYCYNYYFKEYKVAIVVDDFTGSINYHTCSDNEFLTKAEEQGHTWTLKGFEQFIDSGEYLKFDNSIKHPNYIITRFIRMYEHDGVIFCDNEGISNPTEYNA